MSNALEKTAYVENGKLYDNNNNLVDIGNAKITLGSYVGNGTTTITIQVPENQLFFMMLSDPFGKPGDCTNIVYTGRSPAPYAAYGFPNQIGYASEEGCTYYTYGDTSRFVSIQRTSNAQNGELIFNVGRNPISYRTYYNLSGVTYHYATIGV